MNYSLSTELYNNIDKNQMDRNYHMIFKYLDEVTKGVKVKPGTLARREDTLDSSTSFVAKGENDIITMSKGYNEHSYIVVNSSDRHIVAHMDSRLNSVDVSGLYVSSEGNYYISQEKVNKVVRPAKSLEVVTKEVEEELKDKQYSDRLIEINRRMNLEGKDDIRSFNVCKITFYDLESIKYLDGAYYDLSYVNYNLGKLGINPTATYEFTVESDKEMVQIINDFYHNPKKYIAMLELNKEQEVVR